MLDPDVVFLNHGSFGATPRPVFEAYQEWQRRLERQPVDFLVNELPDHLAEARQLLGDYINGGRDDIVYVPNATFALNVIARSLDLGPGDEVLTTDHEYGACNNIWEFLSRKRGFRYKRQAIPFPVASKKAIIDKIMEGVTTQTKVVFLSHITSETATRMPVTEICQLASERGILSVIDGAHAPGQITVDMEEIGADFYFGNAHKWMCSPKGAGFLFTQPEKQSLIEPLVVGWGWGDDRTLTFGSDYLDYMQWLGTNDLAAYLSVPTAIEFQEANDWPSVREECHQLLGEAIEGISTIAGIPQSYPDSSSYCQMAVARLPILRDATAFKDHLYKDYRIEIPVIERQHQHFIRVSIQGYNIREDVDSLLEALVALLPGFRA
ncbi:MAG TPA: aminotransferase class V-fold PLP-dependent enzyme [Anaerolineae bacterium]|nr:aminotransferase class V-fold PLP-dependent enzyme [Anaerolineae bacterium]